MPSNQLIFSMLRHPALTGSLIPSSRYLARTMARQAKGAQELIELGAGTGAITQGLIKYLPDVPLVAVEYQGELAQQLRHRFPQLDVQQTTAKVVLDALPDTPVQRVLVSSLPFRSLPASVHSETVDSILALLKRSPESRMVQFTYGRIAPFEAPADYEWRFIRRVWRNIPPAAVWELAWRGAGL